MSATFRQASHVEAHERRTRRKREPVTVMLADHDDTTRSALRDILERNGFTVVAEVSDADEAVGTALHHKPKICLLDINMPGGGLAAAERLFSELPETRIAILTTATGEIDLLDAIHAGADGYLLKEIEPDRLMLALRALLRGEAVLPRSLTGLLVEELRGSGGIAVPKAERPSRIRYLPRLVHHYRRRRRSGMAIGDAWRSARDRMSAYR